MENPQTTSNTLGSEPQPAESINPELSSSNMPKKRMPMVGLVVLLLILLGGAAFAFKYVQKPAIAPEASPMTAIETPVATTDPTEGWKTYETANFRVKYPATQLTLTKCEGEVGNYWTQNPTGQDQDSSVPQNCARDSRFNLEIVEWSTMPTFDERYAVQSEPIVVGGLTGTKYTFTRLENQEGPGEGWYIDVLVKKDDKVFDFYTRNQDLVPIFDQMLSTFKFTDSQSANQKKYFDPNEKFFVDHEFPSELKNLTDSQLQTFRCSPDYYKQPDGTFALPNVPSSDKNRQDNAPQQLDSELTSLLLKKEVEAQVENNRANFSSAVICTTEQNKKILHYQINSGGGGAGSDSYFGVLSSNNTVDKVAKIQQGSGPYFGCGGYLALTTSNYFYIECGAGDAGYGASSIFKVDLQTAKTTRLIECTSTMDEVPEGKATVKCE